MKQENLTWAEYLSDYYSSDILSKEYQSIINEVEEIRKKFEGWLNLEVGDLRYKNVPKILIKQKNQKFIIEQGHPNFAFRFQCLTTGRQSKLIKTSELQYYGVSVKDMMDGGDYSDKMDIKNKAQEFTNNYYKIAGKIFSKYSLSLQQLNRQSKYNEYLCSDEWIEKRKQCFEKYGYACLLTGSDKNLHVHHLTYENVGNEKLTDLVVLRSDVHEKLHQGNEQVIAELNYYLKEVL
jgi:hypothetical protein